MDSPGVNGRVHGIRKLSRKSALRTRNQLIHESLEHRHMMSVSPNATEINSIPAIPLPAMLVFSAAPVETTPTSITVSIATPETSQAPGATALATTGVTTDQPQLPPVPAAQIQLMSGQFANQQPTGAPDMKMPVMPAQDQNLRPASEPTAPAPGNPPGPVPVLPNEATPPPIGGEQPGDDAAAPPASGVTIRVVDVDDDGSPSLTPPPDATFIAVTKNGKVVAWGKGPQPLPKPIQDAWNRFMGDEPIVPRDMFPPTASDGATELLRNKIKRLIRACTDLLEDERPYGPPIPERPSWHPPTGPFSWEP